ncbi:transmembrane channel-like protein 6 [Rhineura floridana]|uniref:transmembrane channel-like protein 6 n=1 Tax=Rhineura floridana TaxID=261503 RepID=UPI002AC879A6|nr:transmembrane channel-like protein 6 [Rhineura floridana]XP_061471865.1 transmembrane channel-like protein 6 [Rhineura floridana]XP_061471866.1 transmembrane channel-like protein 6 [Rhineura floridana]XP_061471867.1 transmembrane channel-like protein 6 [Rhineura floridana]XP_061471868.1 transmembrane channel-like protein 6 [Rhineura floridana]XP_061471869.1 transmembrane channel-like protein 6 [Rhineura floridana]XP_061471870.1 transmembrane channel-like protein 6 [Rhineura floridana]
MSHTVAFIFPAPESRETASQDISPYNEGAVHDSFHQLIQEQSLLAEQELVEMQELAPRGRENLAYVVSPPRQTEAWEAPGQMSDFSSATLRILASMPSRTIGHSRGAILSQYYNRTARLRRKSSRAPLQEVSRSARPSIRQLDLELDSSREEEETKRSLLVKELRNLPASQRINMLQAMPLSLAEKRKLRQDSSGHSGTLRRPKTTAPLSHCSRLKYHIIIGFRNLWYSLLSLRHTLQPWHYSFKQISGRFGSSILSYFLFLKTLLMFNLFLFLILLVFVVAVQAAYPSATPNSEAFTGLEPLTGTGYFAHTLMYYGYYSNFTLNDPCAFSSSSTRCKQYRPVYLPYNMPLAYVLVTGVSFFVTCLLLVYSMSHSFGESYRVGSASGDLAVKVFCAWDYKVIQKRSARLQSENICTQLKECLAEQRSRSCPLNLCKRLQRLAILLMAWTLSLGTALGCVIGVHYFFGYIHEVHHEKLSRSSRIGKEALLLALPLLVSLINLLMPYMYNLLAAWEKQESPILEVYVAICRNLILKMVILGLLCYHWLSWKVTSSKIECWETFVGQELYRLVVMDFIFILLDTFFGELMWRIILEKKLQSKRRPEFDIARNVLELIYGQTLTWLGVFFAPLLPVVQILKLLLLFYIKKTSLMRNCQSPSKPWRASHMSTIFITLLCFPSFLGASIFLSYTIWAVRPSEICGPFQTHETIYESGKIWVLELEQSNPNLTWFTWIHQHLIQNSFFLFLIAGILLAVIYLNIQVVKGQRKIITLLKEQIANEGEDKMFIIQKLHTIYGK